MSLNINILKEKNRFNHGSIQPSKTAPHDNMVFMKRVAVLILIAVSAVTAVARQLTIKVGVDLVNVFYTVTDKKGHLIPDLNKEDFVLEEDGKKQEIRFFSHEHNLPLTLAVLMDISPSVAPVFTVERSAAVKFFDSILKPKDMAMVISFEKSVTLVQDDTESFRLLRDAIESLEIGPGIGGGTSLYDALYLAASEKMKEEVGQKAIILLSDGDDTTSRTSERLALASVQDSDALIYSLGFRTSGGGFGRSNGQNVMRNLSEETGGSYFFIQNANDFGYAFQQIESELRNQYSLGFISSNTAKDGTYRKIKITPRDPSYKVQARKGYYAADKNPGLH